LNGLNLCWRNENGRNKIDLVLRRIFVSISKKGDFDFPEKKCEA